jgi:uncharacterized membrane protein
MKRFEKITNGVLYALLVVVYKPIKRIAGLVLFFTLAFVFGITVFPLLTVFAGIDKANDFMNRNVLPLVEWWE